MPWIFWLFPIAFAIHNIEEAIWLPDYSKSASKFQKPVERFEFAFAVITLTILSFIITALFYFNGKLSFTGYLYFAFNFGILINVFFPHVTATLVLRKYSPGLLTGLLFLLPTTAYILIYGFEQGYFVFPKFWYIAIPFALLIIGLIPLLFKTGKYIKKKILM